MKKQNKIMKLSYFLILLLLISISCVKESKKNNKQSSEVLKEYYETGELRAIVKTINGLQDDTLFEYYRNGSIKLIQEWDSGYQIGVNKVFDENGNLIFHSLAYKDKDGYLDGSEVFYYDSTKISYVDARVIIIDTNAFLNSLIVEPRDTLKLGKNLVRIYVPNVEYLRLGIENAQLTITKEEHYYNIIPVSKDKKVKLIVIADHINDTRIPIDTIEVVQS